MDIKFKIEVNFSKKNDEQDNPPEQEKPSLLKQAFWIKILMPILITIVSFIVLIFFIAMTQGDSSDQKKPTEKPTFQQNFNF
ncbi:hypothetical protein LP083-1_019 [Listeria phage LP-083-1]|uniref:Transmembrane protein n=1 Tax=Listeria phage LP-083-1 TaxID=1458854 RepID=A0A059T6G7_9CAUD|nr:hypothetical protein LP083-1_019 [Listeria phage LP-083-1]